MAKRAINLFAEPGVKEHVINFKNFALVTEIKYNVRTLVIIDLWH